MIPKLNKIYDFFDDGKISKSRHDRVKIMEIIPFDKIDKKTKDIWLTELGNDHWLLAKKTDYFIKGFVQGVCEISTFVRTKYGGWYSLGFWNSGELDTDGSLMKRMNYETKVGLTKSEFKNKYLNNAFYWVNKSNFMDLQKILQEFGFKCHTGEGFINWHEGFKNLVTFPADKFHNFEYYQKIDIWSHNGKYGETKNYEDMLNAHSKLI